MIILKRLTKDHPDMVQVREMHADKVILGNIYTVDKNHPKAGARWPSPAANSYM